MKNLGVALLWIACLAVISAQAQAPSAADNVAAGIKHLRTGDFFRAVLTLNEAVAQLANQPGDPKMLARVHAFRAMAYTALDQPERARAAVTLALAADPAIAVSAGEFNPAVVALFAAAKAPAVANPEAAGQAAEQEGRGQDAFLAYLTAYRALPEPPTPADDQRLRERIIGVVRKLGTAPAIPPEAREHAAKADRLLEAEAILGTTAGASSQAAAAELRKAVRIAPWWAEPAFKLATVSQKLERVDEALLNLNLYRLADPDGYAATVARAAPTAPVATASLERAVPRPPGPATIYIYWPEQQRGGGRQKVLCNGKQVAELQNNRFVVLTAAAGTHDLVFRDKHVTAVVENGREYHYRASIEGQWRFAMGPDIRLTVTEAAKDEMRAQGMAPNDARRTRSTECVAPRAPRRE